MAIPFISKQEPERDENIDNFMTDAILKKDTENMFDMSSRKAEKNMADYYEKTQIEIYFAEIKSIDALLKGKEPIITSEGKIDYAYPKETITKYKIKDNDNKEHLISERDYTKEALYEILTNTEVLEEIQEVHDIKLPFCNKQGQAAILGVADLLIRSSTALSNYSIDRVYILNRSDLETLNEMIYLNNKEWEVEPSRHKSVVLTIGDRVDAARRRAVDNKANEAAQTTHSISHVIQDSNGKPGIPILGGNKQKGL